MPTYLATYGYANDHVGWAIGALFAMGAAFHLAALAAMLGLNRNKKQ